MADVKEKEQRKLEIFHFMGVAGWTGAGLEDVVREEEKKKIRKREDVVLSCLGCEGSWRADL